MERLLITLLSSIFSPVRIPGGYRFVSKIYSYNRSSFQKGVWLKKPYLNRKYALWINLFSKDLIDHKILFTGAYEKQTNKILESNLKVGDWVLEAGANTGTETVLISRLVGDSGKVLAFEPVDHVVKKLNENLSLNRINNVSVMPLALGDVKRDISFYIYPQDHPNQGMGSKVLENAGLEKINVHQTTIDVLYNENRLPRFDFLKMDVQGAELDILKGGKKTIVFYKPKIFLEAAENLSSLKAIYEFLKDINYTAFLILKNGKLEKVRFDKVKKGNWLAIPN